MNLGKKIVISFVLAIAILWAIGVVFDQLNKPSNFRVGLGIAVLLAFFYLGFQYGPRYTRWLFNNPSKEEKNVKNISKTTGLVLMLALVMPVMTGCTRVGPGHVGIKISMAGDTRGVNEIPLTTGWVFYNPALSSVFEYPTYVQTAVWTKDPKEGNPANEEITFTTKDSMAVSADISLGYQLIGERVPAFYVKFRSDDLQNFTHGFLRNLARDHFNETAGKYTVEQIMGDNEPFIREVRARLQKDLDPIGVSLQQFGFIGAPRPPQTVIDSINSKVQARQLALQKDNEILQAEAEAKKSIAKAEGEAQANRILTASVTPQLILWRQLALTEKAVDRWNGQRPMVEGTGSGLLMQIPLPPTTSFPAAPHSNVAEKAAKNLEKLEEK